MDESTAPAPPSGYQEPYEPITAVSWFELLSALALCRHSLIQYILNLYHKCNKLVCGENGLLYWCWDM